MKPTETKALSRHVAGVSAGERKRSVACLLAAFWVSLLLLNYLHPCCEILAASMLHPHDSVSTDAATADTGLHPHPGSDGAAHDHEHCATSDWTGIDLPDFVLSPSLGVDTHFIFLGILLVILFGPTSQVRIFAASGYERGPPRRLYLTTQRLRI